MFTFEKHQRKAFSFINDKYGWGLFMEMRLGKNLVTLKKAKKLGLQKILWIAPYSAIGDLEKDILEEYKQVGIFELVGTTKNRYDQFNKSKLCIEPTFCILDHYGWRYIPEIGLYDWDLVVLDESVFIKEPKTKTSKFFISKKVKVQDFLTKIKRGQKRPTRYVKAKFDCVPYVACLTGNPNPNSELDYFNQLYFLNGSVMGETNYYSWRTKYFTQGYHNFTITKKGKDLLVKELANTCFTMTKKDAGFVTKIVRKNRYIKFPPDWEKIYKTVEKEYLLELENGNVFKKTKYAVVKWNWLMKLCGGFYDKKFRWHHKLQELDYLIHAELKNNTTIVWCHYVNELDRISDSLKCSGTPHIKIHGEIPKQVRKLKEEDFKNGIVNIALLQQSVYRYGANFSHADTHIYYSQCHGGDTRKQTEARTEHLRKKKTTLIIDLLVENSVEETLRYSQYIRESEKSLIRRFIKDIKRRNNV